MTFLKNWITKICIQDYKNWTIELSVKMFKNLCFTGVATLFVNIFAKFFFWMSKLVI